MRKWLPRLWRRVMYVHGGSSRQLLRLRIAQAERLNSKLHAVLFFDVFRTCLPQCSEEFWSCTLGCAVREVEDCDNSDISRIIFPGVRDPRQFLLCSLCSSQPHHRSIHQGIDLTKVRCQEERKCRLTFLNAILLRPLVIRVLVLLRYALSALIVVVLKRGALGGVGTFYS